MACPTISAAPRCRLRRLYTQPGIAVTGYADDDRVEVSVDAPFTVGRAGDADVVIAAMIGGGRTYMIYWRAPEWIIHVNTEEAVVTVNGERISAFTNALLREGTIVEIQNCHTGEPVHRFRVELG